MQGSFDPRRARQESANERRHRGDGDTGVRPFFCGLLYSQCQRTNAKVKFGRAKNEKTTKMEKNMDARKKLCLAAKDAIKDAIKDAVKDAVTDTI